MSERRYKAHWVQNILHNQKIKFSINNIIYEGNARMLPYSGGSTLPYPEVTLATINMQGNARAESQFGEQGTNMINGKVFDHNRVDQKVKLGDLEEWTITNVDNEDHTFHIHINDFQVMSVNGQRYDAHGLQDTVILPA
jgi:FtsP/CotA-like multicopper oxidase with cupredoxin domain